MSVKTPLVVPRSSSEPVRKVCMALLGCVSGVGSILQLHLDQLWTDPSYEFMKRYVEGVAQDLARLESEAVIDLDAALQKPETRPLLTRAMEAAARSIGERKLEALRAVTVQGIFERRFSFDMSVLVFSLLDRITDHHLRMLTYIKEQEQMSGIGGVGPGTLKMLDVDFSPDGAGQARPEKYAVNGMFYDQYLVDVNTLMAADLENMNLIGPRESTFNGDWITDDQRPRCLTLKGKLFYEHIVADPNPEIMPRPNVAFSEARSK